MNSSTKKPQLTDLVVAIFEHPDAPSWLLGAIADGINDNLRIDSFDPEYVRAMMKFTLPPRREERSNES